MLKLLLLSANGHNCKYSCAQTAAAARGLERRLSDRQLTSWQKGEREKDNAWSVERYVVKTPNSRQYFLQAIEFLRSLRHLLRKKQKVLHAVIFLILV